MLHQLSKIKTVELWNFFQLVDSGAPLISKKYLPAIIAFMWISIGPYFLTSHLSHIIWNITKLVVKFVIMNFLPFIVVIFRFSRTCLIVDCLLIFHPHVSIINFFFTFDLRGGRAEIVKDFNYRRIRILVVDDARTVEKKVISFFRLICQPVLAGKRVNLTAACR